MNHIKRWFMGRYGYDELGVALLVLAVMLGIYANMSGTAFLMQLSIISFALAIFRALSRNMYKRKLENDRLLKSWSPVKRFFVQKVDLIIKRVQYKYFNCPFCKQSLRAPRKKGKITVTCNRCKNKFNQKT